MGNLSLKFFGAGTNVSLCRLSSKSQSSSERIERGTDLFEIRQKILPIPTWVSQFLPRIVVSCGPAVEEHTIHYSSTPNNGSRVNRTGATIKSRLRHTLIIPGVVRRHLYSGDQNAWILSVAARYV